MVALTNSRPLVARGFQQDAGVNFSNTLHPVAQVTTIRLILTIVVSLNWKVRQLDINNVFLNGWLNEDVFMRQHEGFEDPKFPNHVCKLTKVWFEAISKSLV